MVPSPPPSLLVACSFRASDFLIPLGAAALGGSPDASLQLSSAGHKDFETPWPIKGLALGSGSPPEGAQSDQEPPEQAGCLNVHSASFVGEARSPSHRRRRQLRAAAASHRWSTASSGEGSEPGSTGPSSDLEIQQAASMTGPIACESPLRGSPPSASPCSHSFSSGSGSGDGIGADQPSYSGADQPSYSRSPLARLQVAAQDAATPPTVQSEHSGFVTPPPARLVAEERSSPSAGSLSNSCRCSSTQRGRDVATPGSSRGLSLGQQLEVLQAKLAAEAGGRRALQRQLADQRREAEQQRHALGQQYEQRLVALRQELQQAAEAGAVQDLRSSVPSGRHCCMAGSGQG